MYKVANAARTAKVDAPSMKEAAAQFLKLPVERIFRTTGSSVKKSEMFGVFAEGEPQPPCYLIKETDERVAVFEIEEEHDA